MKHYSSQTHRFGFTIVELLVIIVVIAILVSITVVSYTMITDNAKHKTVETDAQGIAVYLNKYKADHGSYPATLDLLDSKPKAESTFQYSYDATTNTYCVTASVTGASAYVQSGNSAAKEGGCPGHGVDGESAVTNLATNPSTEVNLGWSSNNGTTYPRVIDTAVKRSGAQSMKSYGTSAGTTLLSMYAPGASSGNGNVLPSVNAGTYTQSLYFRADVPHTGRIAVAWRVGGVWSSSVSSATITGTAGQWTRVTQTFTVPANVEFVRGAAYVVASSSQPASTPAWVDDYMLVEGDSTPEYADGSSANWLWTSTPNASTSYGPRL
jgi:Tfp pilus assembly protein PilE